MQYHLRELEQSFSETNSIETFGQNTNKKNGKYSILICTDFAFPKFGGVETHTY